jgi:hypothetical protein
MTSLPLLPGTRLDGPPGTPRTGGGWAEIPAISFPPGVAAQDSAPPPGSGPPPPRGVPPRVTPARGTRARNCTPIEQRFSRGN